MPLLLVILLVLLLVGGLGSLPAVGWHQYGYYPSGILGTVLLIVLVVWLVGALR